MSDRRPRFRNFSERQRFYRERYIDRYFPPEEEGGKTSPMVTIILILAVFTCLFICAILGLTAVQLLFQW